MSPSPDTVLILGATGGFGGHAAAALQKHGWRVRAMARDIEAARTKLGARFPVEWVSGDAMNAADVTAAATGAAVIVHAVNPPGYRNWKGLVLPMLASTIAAAKANGSTILLPGNVYNFAPDAGPHIREGAPQAPATRKGKIRVEMEAMLRHAAGEGVRGIVLRAGDFFGPGGDGGLLGWTTVRHRGRIRAIFSAGAPHIAHAFAYLPDLAETAARVLAARSRLPAFADLHFRGHVVPAGDLTAAMRAARPAPTLPFPWWLTGLLGLADETLRELREMRYLWRRPIGLDNARLVGLIGEEPHTSFPRAVAMSVADLEGATAPAGSRVRARSALASAR